MGQSNVKKYTCTDPGKEKFFVKGQVYTWCDGVLYDKNGHPWRDSHIPGGSAIGYLRSHWGVKFEEVAA